jgi:ABC-type ATPase with predicted acetyltransferase domain
MNIIKKQAVWMHPNTGDLIEICILKEPKNTNVSPIEYEFHLIYNGEKRKTKDTYAEIMVEYYLTLAAIHQKRVSNAERQDEENGEK